MSADQPQNPFTTSLIPGTSPTLKSMGRGGEIFAAQIHGKYYTAAYYGRMYMFNRTAVTLGTVTASAGVNFVSVFALYNPNGSTVNLELVDFDLGLVSGTTVVDTVGLYWQGPTLASLATLTTIGVFGTNWFNGLLGGNAGQGNPYSALTHSNAAVSNLQRIEILSQFGAVTSSNDTPIHKEFDGKVILAPGCLVSVGNSTAASAATSIDLNLRWMECPLT